MSNRWRKEENEDRQKQVNQHRRRDDEYDDVRVHATGERSEDAPVNERRVISVISLISVNSKRVGVNDGRVVGNSSGWRW